MGRTPRPLRIVVTAHELTLWPELRELEAQGHDFMTVLIDDTADLVIGPKCWLMDEQHRRYLPDAIKAARAKRYPKENE